jgi:multidrug efflux pump subunit AcrA (membrane-fusion protein)
VHNFYRLSEFLDREQLLEEEKRIISEHASQLKESLEDVKAQKAMTEAELKEEVLARLSAERRLREAEERLSRLERGIQGQGQDGRALEQSKEEMMVDVKAIKQFFERLAAEAKLDVEKSVMMKNTVHARKVIVRRAQTLKYETLRKQRKSKTASRDFSLEDFARMHSTNSK